MSRMRIVDAALYDTSALIAELRIAALLRGEGRAVRTIDTLIAAAAVSVGLPLVTLDGDFESIARLADIELVAV